MKKKAQKIQLSRETLVALSTVAGMANDEFFSATGCAGECINNQSWCGMICSQTSY